MELIIKDAVVSITPTDPNSKETIILQDATVVTKIKDSNNRNAIKIKPFKGHSVEIKNLNSLII